MTVQELIDLLNRIEDKDKIVLINVREYTKSHGHLVKAYPMDKEYLRQSDYDIQINCWLPKNVHTVTRKE
jgi:hypothetical protein